METVERSIVLVNLFYFFYYQNETIVLPKWEEEFWTFWELGVGNFEGIGEFAYWFLVCDNLVDFALYFVYDCLVLLELGEKFVES